MPCWRPDAAGGPGGGGFRRIAGIPADGGGNAGLQAQAAGVRYVDAIGLACPLAAACAARTGKGEYWNLAVKQVEEYDMALLPGSSFPAHGFEMERGYPLGLYDWSGAWAGTRWDCVSFTA